MNTFTLTSESDLQIVVPELVKLLTQNLILLKGEMGAGKTTFVKYLVKELIDYDLATSPTFSIINEYSINNSDPIFHMDLYRLESIEEALNIGIEEYLDSGKLCIIEWPELIEPILPQEYHVIEIKHLSEKERSINFS